MESLDVVGEVEVVLGPFIRVVLDVKGDDEFAKVLVARLGESGIGKDAAGA